MTQTTCSLSFTARATGADLHLCARLNGHVFFDQILTTDPIEIRHDFADVDDTDYTLEIVMSGKQSDHTVVDQNGVILQDRVIEIDKIAIDDLELGQVFVEQARYHHDFNGTQPATVDEFYGAMGCNGTVELKFSAPVYIWLLENM
jgi:hypothetical protein